MVASLKSYNILLNFNETQMDKKSKETINYVSKLEKQVFSQDMVNEFACQCGKIYWTYPALYLHFQRSHKIKISTKVKEEQCLINKNGKVRTFTYFFSKGKEKSLVDMDKQSSLTKLFTQFSNTIENQWDRYPALFLCSKLQKYLLNQQSFQEINFELTRMSSIPNYLNQFMLDSKDLMRTEQIYSYNCNILVQLSKWLNFKGYSNLKIQYNSDTSPCAKLQFDSPSASRSSDSI